VFGRLAAIAAVFTLFVVPVARASTTDVATAAAEPGPYFVDQPITFTSTTPCTTTCRLIWTYLNGTRLGDRVGEGESVQQSFSTPGSKTVQLRMSEFCVGTTRLVCDSVAYVSVFVEDVATPIDTTPPTISVSGVEVEATGPLTAVQYAVGATDPEGSAVTVSCTPPPGSEFPLGGTPIDCTATDASGNVATATFSIVVKDTTPPALHTPTGLAAEATSADGAVVAFDVTAADVVDGDVGATCSTPSGSTFPLGSTLVTCTASDAHGNEGVGRFEVVVKDATPPALTLPDTIVAEATSGDGAAVSYAASATDVVDGPVGTTCSSPSGATFALGATTVQCSATDAAGNTGTGSFEVHVLDTTAPTLQLPDSAIANATTKLGGVATFDVAAIDMAGGDATADCAPASGSWFAIGTTTVTCTATDVRGNTSAPQSFTVTVKGAVAQLSDLIATVTAWNVKGHMVEIRSKGPRWSLTQAPPKVNLACQQIRDFERDLGDSLASTISTERNTWLMGELARIYDVIGCAPVTN
jgi:hypothetical protein